MHQNIRMKIESNIKDVSLASVAIRALCRYFSLGEILAYQIELCVTEIVNNIIEYGYRFEKGHDIEIAFSHRPSQLRITIEDHAHAMPRLPKPKLYYDPDDVENLPERGFGLYLVHVIMDEIHYEPGEGLNRFTMIKTLPSGAGNVTAPELVES